MCSSTYDFAVLYLVVLLTVEIDCGRVCEKVLKEEETKSEFVIAKCNESYQAYCHLFSSKMCTYYEEVDCLKKYNKTVIRYRHSSECCQGARVDPNDNVTCVPAPVMFVSEDSDVSSGIYAAIACLLTLVMCVTILIIVHARKRMARFNVERARM